MFQKPFPLIICSLYTTGQNPVSGMYRMPFLSTAATCIIVIFILLHLISFVQNIQLFTVIDIVTSLTKQANKNIRPLGTGLDWTGYEAVR